MRWRPRGDRPSAARGSGSGFRFRAAPNRRLSENDNSPQAQNSRRISGLADLDGIEFVAKITTKKDQNEDLRNEIRFAIAPDHKDYKSIMGAISPVAKTSVNSAVTPTANNRPAWAK